MKAWVAGIESNSLLLAESFRYSDFIFANTRWLGTVAVIGALLAAMSILSYRKSSMPMWLCGLGLLSRCIGIGILLLCLLEPMATLERPKPQANVFGVVVDRSKSVDTLLRERMNSNDSSVSQLFRDEAEWQRKLGDDFRVRRYAVDSTLEPIETLEGLTYQGSESALYGALTSLKDRFQGRPLAGVILITDGQATDRMPDNVATPFGFPIYPVSVGKLNDHRDIRIASVTTNQSDFETSPVTIQAKVTHHGFPGEAVRVDLLDSQGTVVKTQSLKLKQDDAPVVAEFRFRPDKPGVQSYRVVVRAEKEYGASTVVQANEKEAERPRTSELTLGNNSRYQVVDRGRGPYRILYLAGRPNWEYKFLKRALEEDDEIRLTALVRIARKEPKFTFRDSKVDSSNPLFSGFEDAIPEDKEQYDEPVFVRLGLGSAAELKRGFPKDAEELFEYSAIIMDDIEHDFLTTDQQALVRQFVAGRGGGLLVLGGQESMRGRGFRDSVLHQLLPVYGDDESVGLTSMSNDMLNHIEAPPARFQLTREGWLQPFLRTSEGEAAEKARLASMPAFEVLNHVQGVKPGATVLAEAVEPNDETIPTLVTQRFGKGRTAAFLIGDMWRWGLHNPEKEPSPLYQSWRQMVRWLIADVPKSIEIKIDDSSASYRVARVLIDVKGSDFKSIDNAKVAMTLTSPSGKQSTLPAETSSKIAGQYESTFVAEEEGVYAISAEVQAPDGSLLGTAQLGWVYEPSSREFQEIGENTSVLQRLAKESGGEMLSLEDLDSFVNSLPSRKVPVTETKIVPMWHQGWVLLVALACICGEWGLRRRYGMA